MKKNRSGQIIIITILLVASLAAWGTRIQYNARHPASLQARLTDDQNVVAEFSKEASQIIRQGMKATVSLNGKKFTSRIGDQQPGQPTFFSLRIIPAATGVAPGTPCKVIVDTTIPPELLKDGKS
ncbi:MAG: hypothetical protein ACOYMS_13535 [Terrimicrobiaceae bacterium]